VPLGAAGFGKIFVVFCSIPNSATRFYLEKV
jgi:hypothetical protein